MDLVGSSILITGGTGSFGKAFVRHALDHLDPRRIVGPLAWICGIRPLSAAS